MSPKRSDWHEWFRDDEGPPRRSDWDDKYGFIIVVALTALCVAVLLIGLILDW